MATSDVSICSFLLFIITDYHKNQTLLHIGALLWGWIGRTGSTLYSLDVDPYDLLPYDFCHMNSCSMCYAIMDMDRLAMDELLSKKGPTENLLKVLHLQSYTRVFWFIRSNCLQLEIQTKLE